MRARCISNAYETLGQDQLAYPAEGKKGRMAPLTIGREYDVYAVSLMRSFLAFLVVNDRGDLFGEPGGFFEMTDPQVPSDWIMNIFQGKPLMMVLGPMFIAGSEAAWDDLHERQAPVWDEFRQRYLSANQEG